MRRRGLTLVAVILSVALPLGAAEDQVFLEELLDKGYLELVEKHPEFLKGSGLSGTSLTIKFKKACIKAGKGSADALSKELDTLFVEGEKLIDPKAPTAEGAELMYDYGVHLFDRGDFTGAVTRFEAFNNLVRPVLDDPPSEASRQRLLGKSYDAGLYLGRSHLALMKKTPDDKKEEKLELADKALEYLDDYVWPLQNYSSYAVKAYIPMCELWAYLETQDRKEEAAEFFKSLLMDQQAEDSIIIPLLRVEVNPDSIRDIFEVAQFLVRRAPEADKPRVARDLITKLKKLSLDPTPDLYMKHQLATLLAQFCITVALEEVSGKPAEAAKFKEDAKKILEPIPSDPTKSPYASEVLRLFSELGVEKAVGGGGMAALTKPALKQFDQKQFAKGIRILENLLPCTEPSSAARATTWFYIGQGYYMEARAGDTSKFLSACFAFERCHDTLPTWEGGQKMSAQHAYKLMYNSCKLFAAPRLSDKTRKLDKVQADRTFIQDIRWRFAKAYPQDPEATEALFYWGRDTFLSDWVEGHLEKATEALGAIPEGHPKYAEALFYRFKCAFKKFVATPTTDSKAREELFKLCIAESDAFFARVQGGPPALLKLAAQTRCEVVQLNLLQEGRAQNAVDLLEGDFDKTYGPLINKDEDLALFKAQIPKWHIEGLYKVGTTESLRKAVTLWESWQARALREFETARSKDPAAKLDSNIIKATQDLSNKGIKVWLRSNAGHAEVEAFQKINTQLTTWITKNVQVTPLLLFQLMLTDEKAGQSQSVVDFATQYLELAKSPEWSSGKNAEESALYLERVYRLQLKHLEALDTEEGWAQAAVCQGEAFDRGMAKKQVRPAYLIAKAQDLLKAGRKCPDAAKAREKYFAPVVILSLDIRKRFCAPGDDRWWTTYDLNLEAVMASREFERAYGILEAMRLSVADSQARRDWLLGHLAKLEKLDPTLAPKAATLREGIAQDKAEQEGFGLESAPTPPSPSTTSDASAPKEPQ